MQTALYLTVATTDGWGSQVRSVHFLEVVKSWNVGPGLTQSHGPSYQRRTYQPRPNVLLTAIFTVVSFAVVRGQGNNKIFTCYSKLKFLVMCPLGGKFTTSAKVHQHQFNGCGFLSSYVGSYKNQCFGIRQCVHFHISGWKEYAIL